MGMAVRPVFTATLFCLVISGCAASGTKVSEEQAQSFRVGASTYADVVAAFGNPTSTSVSTAGGRTATYSYTSTRAQPQNFIPYVGPLVSGYDTQTSSVTFTFDDRGILTSTTSTQGGTGVGVNLAAGGNAATQPYQAPH